MEGLALMYNNSEHLTIITENELYAKRKSKRSTEGNIVEAVNEITPIVGGSRHAC